MMATTWIKTVAPVDRNALKRGADGRVVCARCGCAMQAWTPCEGATWYECDCGEVMVVVGGATCLANR